MYGKNLKLALMGALLLISNVTFSQVTERERPKEWDQLVNGARFMDRFLPMKGNKLSSGEPPVCVRDMLIMALKTASGLTGAEISAKEKTENTILWSAAGWKLPQKDIWSGAIHGYSIR